MARTQLPVGRDGEAIRGSARRSEAAHYGGEQGAQELAGEWIADVPRVVVVDAGLADAFWCQADDAGDTVDGAVVEHPAD